MLNPTELKTVSSLIKECKTQTKDAHTEDKQQKVLRQRIEKPRADTAHNGQAAGASLLHSVNI